MTLRLRAHHLLCMLTYVGQGYSPAFTANYDAVARRISEGEAILLIDGPDDICRPVAMQDGSHCLGESVAGRDAAAAVALARLLDRQIHTGLRIWPDARLIRRMRQAFTKGRTRKACVGCQWAALCTSVAKDGYRSARLAG